MIAEPALRAAPCVGANLGRESCVQIGVIQKSVKFCKNVLHFYRLLRIISFPMLIGLH